MYIPISTKAWEKKRGRLQQLKILLLASMNEASDFSAMPIALEIDCAEDGRWIAEIPTLPGCLAHGSTCEEAVRSVEALVLRVMAERVEAGKEEAFASLSFAVPA